MEKNSIAQKLDKSIEPLIQNINEFMKVTDELLDEQTENNKYTENYINKITDLSNDLHTLKMRLKKCRSGAPPTFVL